MCRSRNYLSLFTLAFLCHECELGRIALIHLVIASIFSTKEGFASALGPLSTVTGLSLDNRCHIRHTKNPILHTHAHPDHLEGLTDQTRLTDHTPRTLIRHITRCPLQDHLTATLPKPQLLQSLVTPTPLLHLLQADITDSHPTPAITCHHRLLLAMVVDKLNIVSRSLLKVHLSYLSV